MTRRAVDLSRTRTRRSSASTDDQFVVENPSVGLSGFGGEHAQETRAEYRYTKTIRLAADRDQVRYWAAAARVVEE
jgi:hypothetical protein